MLITRRYGVGSSISMLPAIVDAVEDDTEALNIVHKELDTTMALCGERRLENLGPNNLLKT